MSAPGGKRLVNSRSGLKILCQHDKDASPWDLAEPQWTPDNEALVCSSCNTKFTLLNRRHHCRRCGKIFCNSCCKVKVQLHRMSFVDPVRQCKPCSEITKVEEEFFTTHIKVLFEGAPFHVKTIKSPASTPESPANFTNFSELMNEEVPKLYFSKLTSDQRYLIFYEHDDDTADSKIEPVLDPLELAKIRDLKLIQDEKNQTVSACLMVKLNGNEDLSIRLDSPPEPSRKPSILWLSALNKGIKMILESKKTSD